MSATLQNPQNLRAIRENRRFACKGILTRNAGNAMDTQEYCEFCMPTKRQNPQNLREMREKRRFARKGILTRNAGNAMDTQEYCDFHTSAKRVKH